MVWFQGSPPPSSGIPGFLKGWGSLIVATIALVQPWLFTVWRRFFRPGSVEIYETALLELSYGNFGPSVGLRGTLRALHRDHFIRDIDVVVVKQKDGSTHKLDWVLFRTESITGAGKEEISAEMATGFMVLQTQPHRYSILFGDMVYVATEMKPLVEQLEKAWVTYKNTTAAQVTTLLTPDMYTLFATQQIHVDTFTALDRLMYWEPGRYTLEMQVHTTAPERVFNRRWEFELTKEESARLRLNSLVICNIACEQTSSYYFVNPKYQQPVELNATRDAVKR